MGGGPPILLLPPFPLPMLQALLESCRGRLWDVIMTVHNLQPGASQHVLISMHGFHDNNKEGKPTESTRTFLFRSGCSFFTGCCSYLLLPLQIHLNYVVGICIKEETHCWAFNGRKEMINSCFTTSFLSPSMPHTSEENLSQGTA